MSKGHSYRNKRGVQNVQGGETLQGLVMARGLCSRALDRGQETCVPEGGARRVSDSRQHALQRASRGLMLYSCIAG